MDFVDRGDHNLHHQQTVSTFKWRRCVSSLLITAHHHARDRYPLNTPKHQGKANRRSFFNGTSFGSKVSGVLNDIRQSCASTIARCRVTTRSLSAISSVLAIYSLTSMSSSPSRPDKMQLECIYSKCPVFVTNIGGFE